MSKSRRFTLAFGALLAGQALAADCPTTIPSGCVSNTYPCREIYLLSQGLCNCEECLAFQFTAPGSGDELISSLTVTLVNCTLRQGLQVNGVCPTAVCVSGTIIGTGSQSGTTAYSYSKCSSDG